jgi:transcriptional regulator with XRE-family HTH domain
MASFRPESHKTLVQRLRALRKEKHWSLEVVAARLPGWMDFDFSKLARVERCVRDVSYAELREIARALETSIAELDAHVNEVLGAKARAGHGRPRKRR